MVWIWASGIGFRPIILTALLTCIAISTASMVNPALIKYALTILIIEILLLIALVLLIRRGVRRVVVGGGYVTIEFMSGAKTTQPLGRVTICVRPNRVVIRYQGGVVRIRPSIDKCNELLRELIEQGYYPLINC